MFIERASLVTWQLVTLALWGADPPSPALNNQLIAEHVELALEGRLYLQIEPDQVRLFLRGMEVQVLPLVSHERLPGAAPVQTRVNYLIPQPPEKVVVACSECQDRSSTAGPGDRIGIEQMPADFLVVLDDNTLWLVLSERGPSPLSLLRSNFWHLKLLFHRLDAPTSQWGGQVLVSRMREDDARSFYWALEPGLGVLRADITSGSTLRSVRHMDAAHGLVIFLIVVAVGCIYALRRTGERSNRR